MTSHSSSEAASEAAAIPSPDAAIMQQCQQQTRAGAGSLPNSINNRATPLRKDFFKKDPFLREIAKSGCAGGEAAKRPKRSIPVLLNMLTQQSKEKVLLKLHKNGAMDLGRLCRHLDMGEREALQVLLELQEEGRVVRHATVANVWVPAFRNGNLQHTPPNN